MHYEINVSLRGKHLFATAERSIGDQAELQRALPIIMAKFPKSEGYEIGVTYWPATGHTITPEQIAAVCKGEQIEIETDASVHL